MFLVSLKLLSNCSCNSQLSLNNIPGKSHKNFENFLVEDKLNKHNLCRLSSTSYAHLQGWGVFHSTIHSQWWQLNHMPTESFLKIKIIQMALRTIETVHFSRMANTWWKSLPCLFCCMFEEDNSDFPLLWGSLINDASDSHLLDFPRFLCTALTQRVVQTSCEEPKSILPFPFLQHGLVFTVHSIPTRSHRNLCCMLSSRSSAACHAGYFCVWPHMTKVTVKHIWHC